MMEEEREHYTHPKRKEFLHIFLSLQGILGEHQALSRQWLPMKALISDLLYFQAKLSLDFQQLERLDMKGF